MGVRRRGRKGFRGNGAEDKAVESGSDCTAGLALARADHLAGWLVALRLFLQSCGSAGSIIQNKFPIIQYHSNLPIMKLVLLESQKFTNFAWGQVTSKWTTFIFAPTPNSLCILN
jgi:hypothetical protein